MFKIPPGFIVACRSRLTDVVVLFRIRFHRDFSMTSAAFEVKSKYFNPKIVFVEHGLFSHVELSSYVKKVTTSVTAD